jgi:hypothetical protein
VKIAPKLCPNCGGHVHAAFAYHACDVPCECGCKADRHYMHSHVCPNDGRIYAACHKGEPIVSGADHDDAMRRLGGWL